MSNTQRLLTRIGALRDNLQRVREGLQDADDATRAGIIPPMAKIELVNRKFPDWLKVRLPKPEKVQQVEQMMREARLHTVCESARCPNLPECWSKGSATFMILGDICTRHCGFCAIKTGKPLALDPQEPQRLADAAKRMGTQAHRGDLRRAGRPARRRRRDSSPRPSAPCMQPSPTRLSKC
jgi:hypothetical protein